MKATKLRQSDSISNLEGKLLRWPVFELLCNLVSHSESHVRDSSHDMLLKMIRYATQYPKTSVEQSSDIHSATKVQTLFYKSTQQYKSLSAELMAEKGIEFVAQEVDLRQQERVEKL